MANIIVVNGEQYWQQYFPGHEVFYRRLQTSQWLFIDGRLWLRDGAGTIRVDAVLWRLGAVKPHESHRHVLELIRLAKIPCVNSAQTLLRGYDRLSMYAELSEAGLTIPDMIYALGEHILSSFEPALPAVVKMGNFHGGYGKALVSDDSAWSDIKDISFIADHYVTVEPYIDYVRDIRCLAVGEQFWAMSRQGARWKANVDTLSFQLIDVPAELKRQTRAAMQHLQADVLGLDFLEDRQGEYHLLESNDIPGLSGFPEAVCKAVAQQLIQKISG